MGRAISGILVDVGWTVGWKVIDANWTVLGPLVDKDWISGWSSVDMARARRHLRLLRGGSGQQEQKLGRFVRLAVQIYAQPCWLTGAAGWRSVIDLEWMTSVYAPRPPGCRLDEMEAEAFIAREQRDCVRHCG